MNENLIFLLACVLAYLFGSTPFGFLVAKTKGANIKQLGSGSTGATNVTRIIGWKWGVAVGVLDFAKSFLPTLLARHFYTQNWQIFLLAILPVIGHIFPVWLNFKGGKGVATIFGIIAGFFGLLPFLAFLAVWYLAVRLVKLMSLVNLIVGLLIPLAFWLRFQDLSYVWFGLALLVIIWWSHRENIKRLLAGDENKIVR